MNQERKEYLEQLLNSNPDLSVERLNGVATVIYHPDEINSFRITPGSYKNRLPNTFDLLAWRFVCGEDTSEQDSFTHLIITKHPTQTIITVFNKQEVIPPKTILDKFKLGMEIFSAYDLLTNSEKLNYQQHIIDNCANHSRCRDHDTTDWTNIPTAISNLLADPNIDYREIPIGQYSPQIDDRVNVPDPDKELAAITAILQSKQLTLISGLHPRYLEIGVYHDPDDFPSIQISRLFKWLGLSENTFWQIFESTLQITERGPVRKYTGKFTQSGKQTLADILGRSITFCQSPEDAYLYFHPEFRKNLMLFNPMLLNQFLGQNLTIYPSTSSGTIESLRKYFDQLEFKT